MRHYGIGHWTDYVRGLAGAEEAEMQRHLDSGCESCARVVSSLREVARVADAEVRAAPADDIVAPVRGLGSLPVVAERQVLDLVWDSARAPWLADDREPEAAGRQLHFANSEYELNARVEDGARGGSTLSGRLHSRFRVGVGNLQVRLVSDRRVVDSSSTGDLGEFELPLVDDSDVELQISLGDDRELIASLGDE